MGSSSTGDKTVNLHITNFVRPFTLGQSRSLIEETCKLDFFWMNSIKSECYITVRTLEEAEATFFALNERVWPDGTGRPLKVNYAAKQDLPKASDSPQHETQAKSRLDALFKKTKAIPHIYYLPKNCSKPNSRSRSRDKL